MKRSRAGHRQAGFSLLELTVSLVLFSIIAGTLQLSSTRRLSSDREQDQAERAAGEVYRLANAAQHYVISEGEWPNETLMCEGAYPALDARDLLKGATESSPYWDINGMQIEYALSCDSHHFAITVTTRDATQANRLVQKIPGASASGTTVTAHYPKPAGLVAGEGFMPLDGSATPTATWNFGNQYLFGTRDVITETGQTLLNSVQFATTASHGDLIRKPTCPTNMTPQILTSLNQVSTPSRKPLHGIQLPVDELSDAWRVRAVITGSGGDEAATAETATITAFVKCSY